MINYYSYTKIFWKHFFHCWKIFGRLPGVLDTGESIKIANISVKICQNSKRPEGISFGTRRSCLVKKTRNKKSCDTVPLSPDFCPIFDYKYYFLLNNYYEHWTNLYFVPFSFPTCTYNSPKTVTPAPASREDLYPAGRVLSLALVLTDRQKCLTKTQTTEYSNNKERRTCTPLRITKRIEK